MDTAAFCSPVCGVGGQASYSPSPKTSGRPEALAGCPGCAGPLLPRTGALGRQDEQSCSPRTPRDGGEGQDCSLVCICACTCARVPACLSVHRCICVHACTWVCVFLHYQYTPEHACPRARGCVCQRVRWDRRPRGQGQLRGG